MAEAPTTNATPDPEPSPAVFQPEEVLPTTPENDQVITWTASEYIAHQKSPQWYVMLGLFALILAIIVWLLTRDKISALAVLVGAAFLGGYGARQPRELPYELTNRGLTIGPKYYDFNSFRSFSINNVQGVPSINFLPLKRFGPPISIYYAPENETAIVDLIAPSLPLEAHHEDAIDRLMRRIRF